MKDDKGKTVTKNKSNREMNFTETEAFFANKSHVRS